MDFLLSMLLDLQLNQMQTPMLHLPEQYGTIGFISVHSELHGEQGDVWIQKGWQ